MFSFMVNNTGDVYKYDTKNTYTCVMRITNVGDIFWDEITHDGPHSIWANGKLAWKGHATSDKVEYFSDAGELHRDRDLPAVIHTDGTLEWYINGYRRRAKGLPTVINTDGTLLF